MIITFWSRDVASRNTAIRMVRDAVLELAESRKLSFPIHVEVSATRRRHLTAGGSESGIPGEGGSESSPPRAGDSHPAAPAKEE